MPSYQPGLVILNKYRIEKLVGAGAFGEVYLATHLKLESPRALKVLRKGDYGVDSQIFSHYRQRFELEARLGARVNHPHVIQVYDFDQDGDELVLAMEFAPGGSVQDWLDQAENNGKPMEMAQALRLGREVAAGLAALHARDIVHRDLKPSNILIAENGSAKLADLGVAQTSSGGLTHRTSVSEAAPRHPGTPAFMSPEQETSFTYLKPSSDVYSLGIVLFLALTLRNPKNLPEGARLCEYRPDASPELEALVAEMLANDPKWRPYSGEALVKRFAALEGIAYEAPAALPSIPPSGEAARPPSWDREGTAVHEEPLEAPRSPTPLPTPAYPGSEPVAQVPAYQVPVYPPAYPAAIPSQPVTYPPEARLAPTPDPEPEPLGFDVIIHEAGPRKIEVIKVIRQFTGLGLVDAKNMAESGGGRVLYDVSRQTASLARSALESAGATVVMKETTPLAPRISAFEQPAAPVRSAPYEPSPARPVPVPPPFVQAAGFDRPLPEPERTRSLGCSFLLGWMAVHVGLGIAIYLIIENIF